MKTCFSVSFLTILLSASWLNADVRFIENWQVDLEQRNAKLGPYWNDENGNPTFTIASEGGLYIINPEGISWRSPDSLGRVFAIESWLNADNQRILIAGIMTDTTGALALWSGEGYRNLEIIHLFRSITQEDSEWHAQVGLDDREITLVKHTEADSGDDNESLIIGNYAHFIDERPEPSGEVSGNITRLNMNNLEVVSRFQNVGKVNKAFLTEVGINQESMFILAYNIKRYWHEPFGGPACGFCESGFKLFDRSFIRVGRVLVVPERFFDIAHTAGIQDWTLFKMGDNEKFLAVCYIDTLFSRLAVYNLNDLRFRRELELPYGFGNWGMTFRIQPYPNIEDQVDVHLMVLTYRWELLVVDPQEMDIVQIINLNSRPTDFLIGDFDGDEESDMVLIDSSGFKCWRIEPLGISEKLKDSRLNGNVKLISVYPNPFNSFQTIELKSSFPTPCQISLHDLQGRELRRWQEILPGTGIYRLGWEAGDLPGGMFILQINQDAQRYCREVQLLK